MPGFQSVLVENICPPWITMAMFPNFPAPAQNPEKMYGFGLTERLVSA